MPGVALTLFRVLASCTSLTMILSPMPMVYKIHRTRFVGLVSMIPLISVFANCHMWMMYGYLKHNILPIFGTFCTGEVLALGYVVVYYHWTEDRRYVVKVARVVAAALAIVSLYAILGCRGFLHQTRDQVADVIGFLGLGVTLIMYASPLERVVQVFRHRSAIFIPVHMVIAGTINNLMWITYAVLDRFWFVFYPNVVFFVLGSFQIGLYLAFNPRTHPYMPPEDCQEAGKDVDDVEQSQSLEIVVVSPTVASWRDGESTPRSTPGQVTSCFQPLVSPKPQK